MHAVVVRKRERGRVVEQVDAGGGVFMPAPDKGIVSPVFSYGLPGDESQTPIFSCPVSSIPRIVWRLLELWWQCRLMGAMPVAGGVLDQPEMVRRSFPLFEVEQRRVERASRRGEASQSAISALAVLMGGGSRHR